MKMIFKPLALSLLMTSTLTSGYVLASTDNEAPFAIINQLQQNGADISVSSETLALFANHPKLSGLALNTEVDLNYARLADEISDYTTPLPRGSQLEMSDFERQTLTAYLDSPTDAVLAKFLALYYLNRSLVNEWLVPSKGQALKNSILVDYFFNRVDELNESERWTKRLKKINSTKLHPYFSSVNLTNNEDKAVHQQFYETFNYDESRRFETAAALLDDFAQDPSNIFTAFLNKAVNTWIGGEADFDDPSALHNFLIASYFSDYTLRMAKRMESAWQQDNTNERFRLAPILGGLSVMDRGWLAQLHQDDNAQLALNDEHRQWFNLHPMFHSFTVGASFFTSTENFMEGFFAWGSVLTTSCPEVRTCLDRPRFSFNLLGMIVGYTDYLVKLGAIEDARTLLTYRYNPAFEFENWTIGQEAWLHRENNLEAIAERYHNDDPSDDPNFFFLADRKWGGQTSTCQSCHQAQNRHWTDEEKAQVMPHTDDILTIGTWPEISTTWYGMSKNTCDGAATWEYGDVYTAGDIVQLNGMKYQAKWWTNAQWPESSRQWDVWAPVGSCNTPL
ncbi:hypothetical protein [Motilimonas sp. E26]|uniref:carbohydrate-binding protein n=1 Tax=Motilimonas sp. E26 TaxID=2865674 RepID=UPI001E3A12D6|nr:hypothetical protein [Motilimonas sp. E26]MCE0556894.1 hypothetical protein [Motilimonas sp. E26]